MKMRKAWQVVCLAMIFAARMQAQTSGANNAELNGNYAFSFNAITGNSTLSSAFAAVGRFTADGAGNIKNGEMDTNGVGAGAARSAQAITGTYSIGADHRGVMTLAGVKLAFAMLANGNAQFIEFDAAGGSGTIGSGTMEKADATAYSMSRIAGDYAFGLAGFDHLNNRAAIEGRFTSNGAGALTNAAGDVNAYGTDYAMSFTRASYTVSDTATGRGTMSLAFLFGGTPSSLNFVFYVVNAGKLLAMERDPVSTVTPLLNGTIVQQQTPAGGFSNASLNGSVVIYLTGLSLCSTGHVPKAVAGLLAADGIGALTLSYDENYCHAPNSITGFAGTYNVASNGRTSIMLGGYALVAYLVSLNQAFLFVSDVNVLFGSAEAQAAGSSTNSAIAGNYAGMATTPAGFGVTVFSGEFTADGASPTGNMTGTVDIGAASGPVSGAAFAATYSVSSSPTNGRGTVNMTSPWGGNATAYVISPTKFVMVPMNDPNPSIWVFEQAPANLAPPPSGALSALTLNPTSVVGGLQSSTGTVTLSGPAPAGGAQVTIFSSNTAVASAPASVTIAVGATSASFTVSTSAVTSVTSVTISASYGGATKTASLTVAPVPLPIVASLTLNPTSVVGGLQSSTGTVTLSGPAPAGEANVTVFSSNPAAAVPSSVTIPAGGTSATFTIGTSIVLLSTSSDISASYNNSTRTASLSILL